MFKQLLIGGLMSAVLLVSGCGQKEDKNTIRVGTVAGPETELMHTAGLVAKERFGLTVKVVPFSDYNTPNVALNDGSIDANMFQHEPYLESQIKMRGYRIISLGKVFIYPMGVYSSSLKSLVALPVKAIVAIPNDPTNEARALLLLQSAKLITLKRGVGIGATPASIARNPKDLKFIELDAAELPRSLPDVDMAVINTNYAAPAGLMPENALLMEGKDSLYANLLVVKIKNKDDPRFKQLLEALHSKAVQEKADELFGKGNAIPAWK
jgi:D-methionine transport system substrate-binding protein